MNSMQPGLWPRLRRPLVAILLGVLPFWLFVGMSQTTTVNGKVVQDSSLNVLGVILGIAGLIVVFKMLRDDGTFGQPPRWWPRTLLAILAGLLCAFQVVQSLGLYKVDVAGWISEAPARIFGTSEPGPDAYAGLDDAQEEALRKRSAATDEARLRDDVVTTAARLRGEIVQYNQLATGCDAGSRRFVLQELPPFLTADDHGYIEQAETSTSRRWEKARCNADARQFMAGPLVDRVHRDRDILALQAAAYHDRFGAAPPAEAAAPRAMDITAEGLPVALGATVAEVQAALATAAVPAPDTQWNEPALAAPDRGIRVMFGADGKAARIVLDLPFSGSVAGIGIGDSLRSLNRRLGGAQAGPRDITTGLALMSYAGGRLVFRFSTDAGGVDRIILN